MQLGPRESVWRGLRAIPASAGNFYSVTASPPQKATPYAVTVGNSVGAKFRER